MDRDDVLSLDLRLPEVLPAAASFHPSPLDRQQREKLFSQCFEVDDATGLSADLSKWFLGAPITAIGRDNMKEWLRWAFLNADMDDPMMNEELDSYITRLEVKLSMSFQPGKSDVKSIRLTLDKVNAFHRSMTCAFSWSIPLTHLYLRFNGFRFYRGSVMHTASILPPRPQAIIAARTSKGTDISYWYHRHTARKELPILFVHGIGVGLYPYMQFLKELNQDRTLEEGQIGILAIEILPISSRITRPLLGRNELCQQLRSILQYHGFEKFTLVSHSYGSVISTYLLKMDDIARRASSVILVDPITILLHQPDVVYNFVTIPTLLL
ncbi:uncharacterized protein AB675_5854 [Cyphellophora attinorum]|uniref:AB hydrolase-1 domain-containing protein n=1 Tax=Cyphellophora attinorum TaxID=1664694 RepID=A0A0N0NL83_9EURO|nr:uncharacterized protein AB675_5854 [Phialophora attinorum]KPI38739.1 hypothetical protein AB675_5854 [Phialophora attinorum]